MLKKKTLNNLEWLRDVHSQMLKELDEKYNEKSMLEIKENGKQALEQSIEALNDALCELRMMPAINDFKEGYKQAIIDGKTNFSSMQGKWGKWIISEIRCPNCLGYFDTDCYSMGELKRCPVCDAKLIGEEENA